MSNKRSILSRPRTRIYDANYSLGENYYRPTIDRLDRKYNGLPLDGSTRSPARATSIPADLLEKHERAFMDDDLNSVRRRAEKVIAEPTMFDSRGGRIAMELAQQDIDDETTSALQRIRASRKVSTMDDEDLESTVSNMTSRRLRKRADQMLDSVGISTENRDATELNGASIVRRRAVLKVTSDVGDVSRHSDVGARWTAVDSSAGAAIEQQESSAAIRARQSRARINELEDEMNDMAERQAMRERRAARLKILVAETAADTEKEQRASSKSIKSSTSVVSSSTTSRRQRATVDA